MENSVSLPRRSLNKPWALWFFSVLFAAGYLLVFLDETFPVQELKFEYISVPLLFLYYLVAFILSWFRPGLAGIMFLGWYVFEILLGFFVWTDAAMVLVMGVPIIPIGIFFVVYAIRKKRQVSPA